MTVKDSEGVAAVTCGIGHFSGGSVAGRRKAARQHWHAPTERAKP